MAKPRLPKKTTDTPETIPSPGPSNMSAAPAEPVAAAPVVREKKKSASKKAARKPEIVRTEPRANLVPINLEDEIRRLAYLMSERRGFEPGHEAEDWLAAETEIRERYRQPIAKSASA